MQPDSSSLSFEPLKIIALFKLFHEEVPIQGPVYVYCKIIPIAETVCMSSAWAEEISDLSCHLNILLFSTTFQDSMGLITMHFIELKKKTSNLVPKPIIECSEEIEKSGIQTP